jgi:hypothetical protein
MTKSVYVGDASVEQVEDERRLRRAMRVSICLPPVPQPLQQPLQQQQPPQQHRRFSESLRVPRAPPPPPPSTPLAGTREDELRKASLCVALARMAPQSTMHPSDRRMRDPAFGPGSVSSSVRPKSVSAPAPSLSVPRTAPPPPPPASVTCSDIATIVARERLMESLRFKSPVRVVGPLPRALCQVKPMGCGGMT